jgi:tRNA U34 5-methylaminomethyl-2-thiouridine-forming methyltransferase MnmC
MDSPKFTWIQTRDGSPTLWNNELGESFRSVKGAFTESWAAFVEPSLNYLNSKAFPKDQPITVGEFGLGPGTNWLIWSLAARLLGYTNLSYFVIESDPKSFEMGLSEWNQKSSQLTQFFQGRGLSVTEGEISKHFLSLPRPSIFPSLDEAATVISTRSISKADIWFHDPFGFDVNPEGYSVETMKKIALLLKENFFACSYACNKNFKEAISAIDRAQSHKKSFKPYDLKRERFEFFR